MSTLSPHAPCVQLSQAGDGTSFLWAPAEPRACIGNREPSLDKVYAISGMEQHLRLEKPP